MDQVHRPCDDATEDTEAWHGAPGKHVWKRELLNHGCPRGQPIVGVLPKAYATKLKRQPDAPGRP